LAGATSSSPDVLITGCSAGFGEVIAKTAALAGHRVFAGMRETAGRNRDAAETLHAWARAQGLSLHVVEMDVADDESVTKAFDELQAMGAHVDVVVNNAGIAAMGPLESFDMDQVRYLYEVNVFGPIRVDKAALPGMRERRSGLLIHVSSTLGRILPRSGGLYPASKWAVEGLAESLSYEVRPFGIDVVILEPGAFPTTATSRGLRPSGTDVAAEYAAAAAPRLQTGQPDSSYQLPDLQLIGDEVCRLISLPAGERPLRSVVGPIFTEGVADYNAEYERVRDHMREVLRRPDQAVTWVQRRP
jgi:NAD(P)-dependent dehydrogenase (short-subunit alcohol dehydrogenase family)